jgi:hypothetical protein
MKIDLATVSYLINLGELIVLCWQIGLARKAVTIQVDCCGGRCQDPPGPARTSGP